MSSNGLQVLRMQLLISFKWVTKAHAVWTQRSLKIDLVSNEFIGTKIKIWTMNLVFKKNKTKGL